jgi:PAS domain S-box-containing protein
MSATDFELNERTLSIIHELGGHMPGGFFIYCAEEPEELLYANGPVFDIYGCKNLEEFKELTGYTFKGMVYPEDYQRISESIVDQIQASDEHMDYAEYRIIRKDGAIRWVDDYGHYAESEGLGGLYYVFISDITEKEVRLPITRHL